jgi:hypothetical protein
MIMDCRTFHRNLEDYLQGGLDFAGRFGMERHAQQCFDCGKEMTDAQNLRRMAAGLVRVKAPANFEAAVAQAIVRRRTQGFLHRFRNYWSYSFEWPSWQRMALATSVLVLLGFGLFYPVHRDVLQPAAPLAAVEPLPATSPEKTEPVKTLKTSAAQSPEMAEVRDPMLEDADSELQTSEVMPDRGLPRMESADYLLVGPGNQSKPERMPNRIYMRYGPPSQEAFILNVSH